MFCIKCGKEAAAGNFCKECFLSAESLFEVRNFRITQCPICNSFYNNSGKIELEDAIKNCIKTKHNIKAMKISYRKKGNHILADIECQGIIKPFSTNEKKTADIIVESRQCDDCTKLSGHYYEAVLQVRGPDKNEIMKEIENVKPLSYTRSSRSGYDVRFVKKQDAAKITHVLRKYTIKRTFKLVGEKDGKKIYRACYSVR